MIKYEPLIQNGLICDIKSRIKNSTEVTLNYSSNIIADSNDRTNFLFLFLTNTLMYLEYSLKLL